METLQLYGITADSIPDKSGGFFDSGWNCTEWMTWHKALVRRFGREKGNDLFAAEYKNQGFFDTTETICGYAPGFVKYFKDHGLDLASAPGVHLINNTKEIITNVGDGVENLSKGVKNTAGAVKIIVPLLLISAAIGSGYYLYNNYIKGNKEIKIKGVSV